MAPLTADPAPSEAPAPSIRACCPHCWAILRLVVTDPDGPDNVRAPCPRCFGYVPISVPAR